MNAKQWNTAMFFVLAAISILSIPFFAHAQDMDFGGFTDSDFGGFSDMDFGGFSDLDLGGFSDLDFGGFSDMDFGGLVGEPEDTTTPTDNDGGFDPFDDDFGPIDDDIPGNPPGPDFPPDQDPDDDGCIVNCGGPGPGPTPTPTPDRDRLSIFIHTIILHAPYEQVAGDTVPMRVTFANDGNKKMDNTKVIVMIPDLGVRDSFGPVDLKRGKKVTATFLLELPEYVEPGVYLVRLHIHNLEKTRVVHREIEIVDYS